MVRAFVWVMYLHGWEPGTHSSINSILKTLQPEKFCIMFS